MLATDRHATMPHGGNVATELYADDTHKCIAFHNLVTCNELVRAGGPWTEDACEWVQSNQFLIVDHGRGALLDPGSNLAYPRLFVAVNQHLYVKHLDFVLVSHQDPDVAASLGKWLMATECQAAVPAVWERFIPHYCSPGTTRGRMIAVPDGGTELTLGASRLLVLPAHFLHSVGNFHVYDPVSRILFSGDVGAARVEPDWDGAPVEDFEAHVPNMLSFHERFMHSNKVCRWWVNMVRDLDIEALVPQHGPALRGKAMVQRFLDWFEQLQCGTDLFGPDDYRLPDAQAMPAPGMARL